MKTRKLLVSVVVTHLAVFTRDENIAGKNTSAHLTASDEEYRYRNTNVNSFYSNLLQP